MQNTKHPFFDHDSTLEELAGIKNCRFDEAIDDEAFEDIQVICKRGNERYCQPSPAAPSTPAGCNDMTRKQSASVRRRKHASSIPTSSRVMPHALRN